MIENNKTEINSMDFQIEPGPARRSSQLSSFKKPAKGLAELFGHITSTYELINHLLTFGLDYYWRHQAALIASSYGGSIWLDIGTGPGDMARALARCSRHSPPILAIDFCWPMLSRLRKKKNRDSAIFPIQAQAAQLPLKDNSVDLITVAFATRNLFSSAENLLNCWQEFYRVLKPDGVYINLETSQPPHFLWRRAFHFYVKTMVKPLGHLISGHRAAYSYLASSILRFMGAEELKALLLKAGFSRVEILYLTGGLVALHLAFK
jgi:demethylmenaquinone methyltransferase/2-methoxy-6-polyprenyl-1,4-benzoquinol methylase